MQLTKDISANQLYKLERREGLTNLDFKSWLEQKKSQHFSNITGSGAVPINAALDRPIQDLLGQIHQEGGLQTQAGSQYTFGVANKVWLWAGVGVGLVIITVIVYKKVKR